MNLYQSVCESPDPEAVISSLSDKGLRSLLNGIPAATTGIPALVNALATLEAARRYKQGQRHGVGASIEKPFPATYAKPSL